MSKKIEVLTREVRLTGVNDQDYVCLTDIARYKNADASDDLIRNWLRNRNTLEFLGLWEQINNPGFKPVEFDGIKKLADLNSFTLTPKQWIERTVAIGIQSICSPNGPNGAHHASLGQRPGTEDKPPFQALKGRHNPCRNHWPASTFTSSSAPKIAKISSQMRSARHCMLTWPACSKTSDVIRFSSIPLVTMCIFSLISHAPWPSAKPWKMSKNHLLNGSKPKAPVCPRLPGNLDTERSPFPSPMWKRSENTSQSRKSIIGRRPFKRNTGSFWSDMRFRSMKNTSGIDPQPRSPLSPKKAAHASQRPSPNGAKYSTAASLNGA